MTVAETRDYALRRGPGPPQPCLSPPLETGEPPPLRARPARQVLPGHFSSLLFVRQGQRGSVSDEELLRNYYHNTLILRCQLIHLFENINFYILIPPSQYDNKEILRLQGSVEGLKILRFRFL